MRLVRFTAEGKNRNGDASWGLILERFVYPLARPPYESPRLAGEFAPEIAGEPLLLSSVKLLAPCEPRKVICVGRNYAEHAAEFGNALPEEPAIFLKASTTLVGPDEPVIRPSISERVDHEGELALVIGKRCRFLNAQDAHNVILGYTCANDVTARDLQRKDVQWTRGKNFDTFCPVGPWLDTEYDPAEKSVRCLVNGEVKQESNTALMIHTVGTILAYVSNFMTLEPGDLVLTGTPAGVSPLQPGDIVTVEIEGLGILSNPVIAGV
ncbi:MAG: fumarylacetoacetate hydrolase family protein [Caldilineaceae bacterium]|nr:fumarylacetoacetate hydrolase family protein [Caldilineaceae bacterium]HRJ45558.1 fumarylacetoacetate hydrolase family protein [Caldilineaceae bacterium]